MKWLQRIVNNKLLMAGESFNAKDKDGNFLVCWNEVFEGETPREVRKVVREKYPMNQGFRLGFTKKVK